MAMAARKQLQLAIKRVADQDLAIPSISANALDKLNKLGGMSDAMRRNARCWFNPFNHFLHPLHKQHGAKTMRFYG